jgi:hypothetical protein
MVERRKLSALELKFQVDLLHQPLVITVVLSCFIIGWSRIQNSAQRPITLTEVYRGFPQFRTCQCWDNTLKYARNTSFRIHSNISFTNPFIIDAREILQSVKHRLTQEDEITMWKGRCSNNAWQGTPKIFWENPDQFALCTVKATTNRLRYGTTFLPAFCCHPFCACLIILHLLSVTTIAVTKLHASRSHKNCADLQHEQRAQECDDSSEHAG